MLITREEAMSIIEGFETADDEGQLNADGYRLLIRIAEEYGEEAFVSCPWLLERARK